MDTYAHLSIQKAALAAGMPENAIRTLAAKGSFGPAVAFGGPGFVGGHRAKFYGRASIERALGRELLEADITRAKSTYIPPTQRKREMFRWREALRAAEILAIAEAATVTRDQEWIDHLLAYDIDPYAIGKPGVRE